MLSAVLGCLLATGIAIAASGDPPETPGTRFLRGVVEGDAHMVESPPRLSELSVGGVSVTLNETPLSKIIGSFGGAPRKSGEYAATYTWICYLVAGDDGEPPKLVWLAARDIGNGAGKINAIAIESAAASTRDVCTEPRTPLSVDTGPLPWIGATRSDLRKAFGKEPNAAAGITSYLFGTVPAGDGINAYTYAAEYWMQDGTAKAAALVRFVELE